MRDPFAWYPHRIELIAGFSVGHFTLPGGESGCTVVLPPPGNVAAYDMRGSSPGSRELSSLDLERRATEVHAILLTGGSVFGLHAADGVVAWLEERGVGYRTDVATIPIVPAAVIFDLAAARGSDGVTQSVRPAHTRYDGDVTFAVAAAQPEATPPADLDTLGMLATEAMAAAVRNAVRRP